MADEEARRIAPGLQAGQKNPSRNGCLKRFVHAHAGFFCRVGRGAFFAASAEMNATLAATMVEGACAFTLDVRKT
jgi:hypothetical protein